MATKDEIIEVTTNEGATLNCELFDMVEYNNRYYALLVEEGHAEDDEPEFSNAWNGIYNQVLGRQSADGLDTVSGATYSSNGLIQAFQSAISQAKQ